jgi:hypothetical protein
MTDIQHEESELIKIKRKIRALSAKVTDNGCTEGEAMLAMKKVGELLLQYNLTMDEVTLRQEPCITRTYTTEHKKRNVLWEVFYGLSKLCGVKIYMSRPGKYSFDGITWSFFGLESDVDMAVYLADFLSKTEQTAACEFKRTDVYRTFEGHRHTIVANFKQAFGQRINMRLSDLADEAKAQEAQAAKYHQEQMAARMVNASPEAQTAAANATTGTALICIAKAQFVNEEFVKRGPKLRNVQSKSSMRHDAASRQAGWDAGGKVNLNRPIGNKGGNGNSGLLS